MEGCEGAQDLRFELRVTSSDTCSQVCDLALGGVEVFDAFEQRLIVEHVLGNNRKTDK